MSFNRESYRFGLRLKPFICFIILGSLLLSVDSDARRFLRIDFDFSWIGVFPALPGECEGRFGRFSGPVVDSIGLDLSSINFSSSSNTVVANPRCERTQPYTPGDPVGAPFYFNANNIEFREFDSSLEEPEFITPGIRPLIGNNTENLVNGYTIGYENFVSGLQWVFITFPNDVVLIRFRGEVIGDENAGTTSLRLTSSTRISRNDTIFFQGDMWRDYNGEFFCFEGQNYRGVWDEQTSTPANPLPGCSIDNAGHRPFQRSNNLMPVGALAAIVGLLSEANEDNSETEDECSLGTDIGLNTTVSGTWNTNDRRSDARAIDPLPTSSALADDYIFELLRPSIVDIELTSNEDTFLYVRDMCAPQSQIIARNDDSSDLSNPFNSKLRLTLNPGRYWIEATTFGSNIEGDYRLNLQVVSQ